jgi:hypothetical protein
MPEPPLIEVETWVDAEEVPNYDAPEYKEALDKYYVAFGIAQIELINDAVRIISSTSDIDDLRKLGLVQSEISLLPFITRNQAELQGIVEEVFYNSTVTLRGIYEATKLFGVKWRGRLINPLAVPPTGAIANCIYGDWMAARWGGYRWDAFCELSGPRQSEIVALYKIDNRLNILMTKGGKK